MVVLTVFLSFLLYLSVSREQNEEIRTEDFMNFSNPMDSRDNRQLQNIDLFIEQYLNFNEDNLQESENHAEIQAQEQNNMASDLFYVIPYDSSFMNVESTESTCFYDQTSDKQLLYDEIEFFPDSISLKVPNSTIGTTASSIEPECKCVGLCLCITTPKPEKNTLDINSICYIDSDNISSDIILINKQNQHDNINNKDISQWNPLQIECEIEADLNSTEQCLEQEIYPDITENIQSSKLTKNIALTSHTRYNPKNPEQIKKLYIEHENKMVEALKVKTKLKEEIQSIVHPSTTQEIVISGVKNAKKRKYSDESNKHAIRKYRNAEIIGEESHPSFNSEGSKTCSNDSENELLVNQVKIIYDPESQETLKELEYHLKNCDFHAQPQLKQTILSIIFSQSKPPSLKYTSIQPNQNISKTEKSNDILYIFGTYMSKPTIGGATFTVRVPKLFEDQVQFECSGYSLASTFIPMTIGDGYYLTLKMSKNKKKMKLPSASFRLDIGTVYVPTSFHAYHFKQVIRFVISRRVNDRVFYHFDYWPEKEVSEINS
ncbi:hypothetical protein M153_340006403 [Pseudoloma neurophilia]|uniref:Uncharacterized protein n=1 Tax=Pseudoloma neurophilia TaxID=146866 RepID=A0A0R0M4J1_9MICR|nr:hypothetical protein M153_340006403 [Pseudoloma neurophilia]